MAILKNIEVRVFSNGQPLHEYDDLSIRQPSQDVNHNTAAAYKCIESQLGANFELEYKVNRGFDFDQGDCLEIILSIDGGSEISSAAILESDLETHSPHVETEEGLVEQTQDRTTIRKFRFDTIKVDENVEKVDDAFLASLGCIKVTIYWAQDRGKAEVQTQQDECEDYSILRIPEKSMKGRASDTVAKFDSEIEYRDVIYHDTDRVSEVPLAVFVFRYLTHDSLLKSGIIQKPDLSDPFEVLQGMTLDRDQIDRLNDIATDARRALRLRVKQEEDSSSYLNTKKRPLTQYDPDELEEIKAPVQPKKTKTSQLITVD